jgi:orotidine-5'-phosphate decarboxylase
MGNIFVAIDTADMDRARALAKAVQPHAGGLKLGLEFFCANGRAGVAEIASLGLPLFLDLKLHDIPNTVAKAVAALQAIAPAVLTVHAAGGEAMLKAAKDAAPEGTRIVAVTVLTSLDGGDLADAGVSGSPAEQVRRLAALSQRSGVDGIVCSGAEVAAAYAAWPEGYFVVPGVRPDGGALGDQKRVVTPRQALDDGASMLVIGRPITGADDPAEAIRRIAEDLRPQAVEV